MRLIPLPLAALLLGVAFTWPGAALSQPMAGGGQVQALRAAPPPATAPTRARPLAGAPSSSLQAQFIDDYDLATGVLTIPLVLVDTVFYRDVRTTLQRVESIGNATGPSGVFDRPGGHPLPRQLTHAHHRRRADQPRPVQAGDRPRQLPRHLAGPALAAGHPGRTAEARVAARHELERHRPAARHPAFILPGAPGAPAGCSCDLPTTLERTMRRLKQLGSDYVSVTQWHWATNRPDGSWTFTRAIRNKPAEGVVKSWSAR